MFLREVEVEVQAYPLSKVRQYFFLEARQKKITMNSVEDPFVVGSERYFKTFKEPRNRF
jgi:hypothetical protein